MFVFRASDVFFWLSDVVMSVYSFRLQYHKSLNMNILLRVPLSFMLVARSVKILLMLTMFHILCVYSSMNGKMWLVRQLQSPHPNSCLFQSVEGLHLDNHAQCVLSMCTFNLTISCHSLGDYWFPITVKYFVRNVSMFLKKITCEGVCFVL